MWNNLTAALIKKFPAVYGLSLPAGALRHATLALAACYLPSAQHEEKMEFHAHKARSALITKLTTPSAISDADVLAAFLLAIYAWNGPPSPQEILVHVRGCLSMLNTLSKTKHPSTVLHVWGPLIFDYLNELEFWVDFDPRNTFQLREHIFGMENYYLQRLKYVQTIRIDFEGAEWNSAIGWAIHTTTIFLFDMLFCIILNTSHFDEFHQERLIVLNPCIKRCWEIVKSQFHDPEFQAALRVSRQWQQKPPAGYVIQWILMTRSTLLKIDFIPLLLSILEAPSVLQGTCTTETISIATALVESCQVHKNDLCCYHLSLLGLALNHQFCVKSKFPSQYTKH